MAAFPDGFFDRADERPDDEFYAFDRLVTHIDDDAIAAVSTLYRELGLDGEVLDLCSSWISHFDPAPRHLTALGMNAAELAANEAADETVVHDLNRTPRLPFDDDAFDAVTCCVSVDYLTRPVDVFAEVGRVLRPGGPFVVTFSNRCFPTKAIRAWLGASDRRRCSIVATYFALSERFEPATVQHRNPRAPGDPLFAVWAPTWPAGVAIRAAAPLDQAFITEMQYEALFVPDGADPPARSVLESDGIDRYHADFGARSGDVGRIAVAPDGRSVGAAWVRRIPGGYGWVDDDTPELGIAVVPDWRGSGVGGALLRSLTDAVGRMSLSVDDRNPAVRLYGRHGFEPVRRDGDHTVVMLRAGEQELGTG